jgi:hypothetical protein
VPDDLAQVPDEWWADEEYDQSCPTCGALIDHGKKKLHQDWHDWLDAGLREGRRASSLLGPIR